MPKPSGISFADLALVILSVNRVEHADFIVALGPELLVSDFEWSSHHDSRKVWVAVQHEQRNWQQQQDDRKAHKKGTQRETHEEGNLVQTQAFVDETEGYQRKSEK